MPKKFLMFHMELVKGCRNMQCRSAIEGYCDTKSPMVFMTLDRVREVIQELHSCQDCITQLSCRMYGRGESIIHRNFSEIAMLLRKEFPGITLSNSVDIWMFLKYGCKAVERLNLMDIVSITYKYPIRLPWALDREECRKQFANLTPKKVIHSHIANQFGDAEVLALDEFLDVVPKHHDVVVGAKHHNKFEFQDSIPERAISFDTSLVDFDDEGVERRDFHCESFTKVLFLQEGFQHCIMVKAIKPTLREHLESPSLCERCESISALVNVERYTDEEQSETSEEEAEEHQVVVPQ